MWRLGQSVPLPGQALTASCVIFPKRSVPWELKVTCTVQATPLVSSWAWAPVIMSPLRVLIAGL